MDTVTIEFPEIAEPAETRADVALAKSGEVDLAKVDLKAVALAQFQPQREALALAKKTLTGVVHDLPTQAKVDEAVSLRNRLIKQPIADARATSKALKSKLTQVAKDVTAEEEAIVSDFDATALLITPQIDAAQKKIDDEKAAAKLAKEKRLQGLRDDIDAKLAPMVEHCTKDDMTPERITSGITIVAEYEIPAAWSEVKAHWVTAQASALTEMRRLHAAAVQREAQAAIEAQRLENERVAAENARIAAEAAAESARVAAAAAAEKAAAEALMEQARQMLADAEAKRLADEESEAARLRAITPAAPVATAAAILGTAETPEPQQLEAAPINGTDAGKADLLDGVDQQSKTTDAPQEGWQIAGAGVAPGQSHPTAADAASLCWRDPAPNAAQPLNPSLSVTIQIGVGGGVGGLMVNSLHGADVGVFDDLELCADQPQSGTDESAAADIASRDFGGLGPEDQDDDEGGIDAKPSDVVRDRALDLKALIDQARSSKFPKQPKMGAEWFAALYAAVDALALAAGV